MNWTNDQLKAIKTRGGKVLVSAAAGSGKTAVLSERVLDFINNGGDVDKLLVVTFTDAAALEMKLRIKKKIEEAALINNDSHLIKQLTLIDNAKITTMDAFYSEIVKQNFDVLNIRPDFSILQPAEESILKEKVSKEVLEQFFDEPNYIKMLKVLNATDEDLIKDDIIKISNFLSTIPFYNDYVKECINKYDGNDYKEMYLSIIKKTMTSYSNLYNDIKEELHNASDDFDKLSLNIAEEETIIGKLLKVNTFDELSSVIRLSSFTDQARIAGHKDDYVFNKYKAIRKKFKSEIQVKLSDLANITDEVFNNQTSIIKETLSSFLNVVISFNDKLLEEKRSINKYSFSDIPIFVTDLLIKDNKKTLLAEEMSNLYDEILIDEYQDTNKLQSIIFNALSKDGTNIFLVGDIKQSIYRFRSACPEIFNNDKNTSYRDKFPMLITLSKNYRSRSMVLDFCNFIFKSTMSSYIGEVDYNDEEKLYVGADFPDNNDVITEIDIINNEIKSDEDDELSNHEKEAIVVANRVKELLDSKYQVYDKSGNYRCIRPSDIAILFRSLTYADKYRMAMENRGISVYVNKDVDFFDNYDVMLIISILKVIDNVYDDVSLMSVLKSSIYNISDNDIASLRIDNKYGYLYDAIINGNNDNIKCILKQFKEFRNYANNNTNANTLSYVYNKLSLIEKLGLNKNKIKNLTLMIKSAEDFDNGSTKSIHEFVSYIDEILVDKSSFKGSIPLSDGDNVLISTIHKSKGLEYPIVFVCEMGYKFNGEDNKSNMLFNNELGITFNITDYDNHYSYEPVVKKMFKKKMRLSQLSEELRVLYVALTRAREKLIITGYVNNLTKTVLDASFLIGDNDTLDNLYLESSDTYLKWIIGCLLKHKDGKLLIDKTNANVKTFANDCNFDLKVIDAINIKDENLDDKTLQNINDTDVVINNYDDSLSKVPSYLSVSEIKTNNHKFYRKPYFLNSDVKSTNVGTLYHKIFELLPVMKYGINNLRDTLDDLVSCNKLSKEEVLKIDMDNVLSYLTSDLYDMILMADKVYKEYPVTFKAPASLYDINMQGDILVDGIIDLLFYYDESYYIVDYKTDNVSDMDALVELYKKQLDLYEIAIMNKNNVKKVRKFIYSIKLNKYVEV